VGFSYTDGSSAGARHSTPLAACIDREAGPAPLYIPRSTAHHRTAGMQSSGHWMTRPALLPADLPPFGPTTPRWWFGVGTRYHESGEGAMCARAAQAASHPSHHR
jgi:hypothetical protein